MASISDLVVGKLTPIYGDHDFDSLLRFWWEAEDENHDGHPTYQQLYDYLEGEGSVSDKMLAYWTDWEEA